VIARKAPLEVDMVEVADVLATTADNRATSPGNAPTSSSNKEATKMAEVSLYLQVQFQKLKRAIARELSEEGGLLCVFVFCGEVREVGTEGNVHD
jgi:hypothetical protein